MGLIGWPEMLVRNYYYSLRNNPVECSSQDKELSRLINLTYIYHSADVIKFSDITIVTVFIFFYIYVMNVSIL